MSALAGRADFTRIACEVRHDTELAVLIFDGEREVWLPKSQVEIVHESDGSTVATMPEWMAIKKGLI